MDFRQGELIKKPELARVVFLIRDTSSQYRGSRGRRILHPGTHKSGYGLLKIPKAESAKCMFFSRGTTTNYDRII